MRRYFLTSTVVVVDFDKQIHTTLRPKDCLHIIRDNEPEQLTSVISVHDDAVVLVGKKEWISFLANRSNKAALVHYLCEKMKSCNDNVRDDETLIVSFEGNVFEILSEGTTQLDYLSNNHNESDTRVFFFSRIFKLKREHG